jgi:hypothetical protein
MPCRKNSSLIILLGKNYTSRCLPENYSEPDSLFVRRSYNRMHTDVTTLSILMLGYRSGTVTLKMGCRVHDITNNVAADGSQSSMMLEILPIWR